MIVIHNGGSHYGTGLVLGIGFLLIFGIVLFVVSNIYFENKNMKKYEKDITQVTAEVVDVELHSGKNTHSYITVIADGHKMTLYSPNAFANQHKDDKEVSIYKCNDCYGVNKHLLLNELSDNQVNGTSTIIMIVYYVLLFGAGFVYLIKK